MIIEVVNLRHIVKAKLSYEFNVEFELWADIDSDYRSIIREHLKIKQLPNYNFTIGQNAYGNETAHIPFTMIYINIERAKIENLQLELPLVIKNIPPLNLSEDYRYTFYDYLESNPVAKAVFLGLGNPRDNYDLANGHKIILKNSGNPEAMDFYQRIKQFVGISDVQFWYATDFIYSEFDKEYAVIK